MFEKEKLIPVVGLLVFMVALVGLLFGDRLGWVDMLRQIPWYIVLGIFIVGMFGMWRMRPTGSGMGQSTIVRILVVTAVIAMIVTAWRFFAQQ